MQLKSNGDGNNNQNDFSEYYKTETPADSYQQNAGMNNPSYQQGGMNNSPYQQGGMNNSPYQQGGMNNSPYQQGGGMNNQPAQPNGGSFYYSAPQAAVQKKSSFPAWIIVVIILAVVGIIGIFVFDKIKSVFGKADYIPGVVEGNVYTNEFFKIKLDLNENWSIQTSVDDPQKVKEALDRKELVQEFYAAQKSSVKLIAFRVKQLPYNFKAAGVDIHKEMKNLDDKYVESLTREGFTVDSVKQDSKTIAGQLCEGYILAANYGGTKVYIAQYYFFKENYVGSFTTGATSEGAVKSIIENNVKSY